VLLGRPVRDETGEVIGTLADVLLAPDTRAIDKLVIERETGARVLVPATASAWQADALVVSRAALDAASPAEPKR
jgi:sporulation protein YlmC with PRC-barrel domain